MILILKLQKENILIVYSRNKIGIIYINPLLYNVNETKFMEKPQLLFFMYCAWTFQWNTQQTEGDGHPKKKVVSSSYTLPVKNTQGKIMVLDFVLMSLIILFTSIRVSTACARKDRYKMCFSKSIGSCVKYMYMKYIIFVLQYINVILNRYLIYLIKFVNVIYHRIIWIFFFIQKNG